jgi:hypothetical protein
MNWPIRQNWPILWYDTWYLIGQFGLKAHARENGYAIVSNSSTPKTAA